MSNKSELYHKQSMTEFDGYTDFSICDRVLLRYGVRSCKVTDGAVIVDSELELETEDMSLSPLSFLDGRPLLRCAAAPDGCT